MLFPIRDATRYVTPLREGGSLPAILETTSGEMFVTKFRGAGQGAKALIAELIAGGLAKALDLSIPDLALIRLDASFGRAERDPEIQDILRGSHGLNVGMRFLEGALNYDAVGSLRFVDPEWAAKVVWFDAFITNIDRTARNPNMMLWNDRVVLIDHGASLYFHHNWNGVTDETARRAFQMINSHVLLPVAADIEEVDEKLAPLIDSDTVEEILASIPDELLTHTPESQKPAFDTGDQYREAYGAFLLSRLQSPRLFVSGAEEARQNARDAKPKSLDYRR